MVMRLWMMNKKRLKSNGSFLCKLFVGGDENGFYNLLETDFHSVKRIKPDASRNESKEIYFLAQNYKNK